MFLTLRPKRAPPFSVRMSRHMDFIGQRADKFTVEGVEGIEDVRHADGVVREGVVKKIYHYTVSCPECDDGDGYYDDHGEIVCEDCGMVLSGGRPANLRVEYSADNKGDDSIGKSRGVEKMPTAAPGTHEPG